ncbi:type 1 fimbrial protein [Escherichia coli]|nr:type 1 fimbrial protein [Escherichia coli]EFE7175060.1 type 1 fimbrial protein [Escherichia coli]EFL0225528.1 type 1 fimbrial protein [Escherichia coli]EGK3476280.1 type 1 fimbrial protein [Escherichia coli]EIP7100592.1 type 1 fimbrial protein [Escherichia coli]
MKVSAIATVLMASLGMVTLNANAASTGTITFNGEVTSNTCDVVVDNQSNDAIITLPTVSTSDLSTQGKTAGRTGFVMALNNCVVQTPGQKDTVSAFFQSGQSVNLSTGRLNNTDQSGASNVSLQLLDVTGNYQPIKVGNTSQVTGTAGVKIANNQATLPYAVEYYAEGQSTAGLVKSTVVYNLQYK